MTQPWKDRLIMLAGALGFAAFIWVAKPAFYHAAKWATEKIALAMKA